MNTKPVEWTVDFEWSRCLDKYRLTSHVEGYMGLQSGHLQEIRKTDGAIEAVSNRFDPYRPFDVPALFVQFAKDTPATPSGMLAFCNKFGIPGGILPPVSHGVISYVGIDVLLRRQMVMRRAFNLFEKGDSKALMSAFNASDDQSAARIELRQAQDGRLYWCPIPPDLIRAMWFQFAMHASSEAKLFRCKHCNEPFAVGTHTGRRSTAVYCSNACKVAAFKQRQG